MSTGLGTNGSGEIKPLCSAFILWETALLENRKLKEEFSKLRDCVKRKEKALLCKYQKTVVNVKMSHVSETIGTFIRRILRFFRLWHQR